MADVRPLRAQGVAQPADRHLTGRHAFAERQRRRRPSRLAHRERGRHHPYSPERVFANSPAPAPLGRLARPITSASTAPAIIAA